MQDQYMKLLQLYSKECQYAGAMRYLLTMLQREARLIKHRKDTRVAARELIELIISLERGLETIKETCE